MISQKRLLGHADRIQQTTLLSLFEADPTRADCFTYELGDLVVDLAKNLIDQQVLGALTEHFDAVGGPELIAELLAEGAVNTTEGQSALHLRSRDLECERTRETLDAMADFCTRVRSGKRHGFNGDRFQRVVHLGIGGNETGTRFAYEALRGDDQLEVHFLSNIDGGELKYRWKSWPVEETLFVVSSKSFGTLETAENLAVIRRWVVDHYSSENEDAAIAAHFVAVTGNPAAALEFGVQSCDVFPVPHEVGGRFSVSSAVGLSLMLAIGVEKFTSFLSGMNRVDNHVRANAASSAVLPIPAVAALVGCWHSTYLGIDSHAILPYGTRLRSLVDYVQQLDMESNGKSVSRSGEPVTGDTVPVIWGGPGTNCQHSFMQCLHQGTRQVSAEFVGVVESGPIDRHHQWLSANMLAQAQVLAFGSDEDQQPELQIAGNQPSTTILLRTLTPSVLGQLLAFYEHRAAYQGAFWGINSFDQFGVELGKSRAEQMMKILETRAGLDALDTSTRALLERFYEKPQT